MVAFKLINSFIISSSIDSYLLFLTWKENPLINGSLKVKKIAKATSSIKTKSLISVILSFNTPEDSQPSKIMSTKTSPTSFSKSTLINEHLHSPSLWSIKSASYPKMKPPMHATKLKKVQMLIGRKKRKKSAFFNKIKKANKIKIQAVLTKIKLRKAWKKAQQNTNKTCENQRTNRGQRKVLAKARAKAKRKNLWLQFGLSIQRKEEHTKIMFSKITKKSDKNNEPIQRKGNKRGKDPKLGRSVSRSMNWTSRNPTLKFEFYLWNVWIKMDEKG